MHFIKLTDLKIRNDLHLTSKRSQSKNREDGQKTIGQVNIGIIFFCIGNSQLCRYVRYVHFQSSVIILTW